jgi:hypothetical protein
MTDVVVTLVANQEELLIVSPIADVAGRSELVHKVIDFILDWLFHLHAFGDLVFWT